VDTTPRARIISRHIQQPLPPTFDGQDNNRVAYTPGDISETHRNHQKRLTSSTLVIVSEKLSFYTVALLGYFGMITLNLKIVMCMCFGRLLSMR
jgi:hypothetical protein